MIGTIESIPGMMCFPRAASYAWSHLDAKPESAPDGCEWVRSCEPTSDWFVHAVQNRRETVGRVNMAAGFVMGIVPWLGLFAAGMLWPIFCLVGGFGLMYVMLPPALFRLEAWVLRRSMRRGFWWIARPIAEPLPRFNLVLRQAGA